MMETADITASGLGYNGIDKESGKDKWDKIVGVYYWDCELATNINTWIKWWNYRVYVWLKYYVSERFCGAGNP